MEQNDIEKMVNELDMVTRELDEVQREVTREIAEKISSIQRTIESLPSEHTVSNGNAPREIILEKSVARVTVKDNGETVFDGLFDQ